VLLKRDTTIGQMVESADSASKGGVAKPTRPLAIAWAFGFRFLRKPLCQLGSTAPLKVFMDLLKITQEVPLDIYQTEVFT